MTKYHVGVDIGKQKHKACIRTVSQDSYSGAFSVQVSREGFEKLLTTLKKHSPDKDDFVIGIESEVPEPTSALRHYFRISHHFNCHEIAPFSGQVGTSR